MIGRLNRTKRRTQNRRVRVRPPHTDNPNTVRDNGEKLRCYAKASAAPHYIPQSLFLFYICVACLV